MNHGKGPLIWLATLLVAGAATTLDAATVTVFAAASLTDSLQEIATAYERESGDRIVFNFAAASFLARQIAEGAPADIFFSADEAKMDWLEELGLVVKDSRTSRLSNSLVVVVTADSPLTIESAEGLADAKITRIALADPKIVPAGIYAKQYLEQVKLWAAVRRKVIPTANVRAALAAVESGNVEVGIVYGTDAAISPRVKVAYKVPESETPAISYPLALLKEARDVDAAKRFLKYLNSDEAGRVFAAYGFIVRH